MLEEFLIIVVAVLLLAMLVSPVVLLILWLSARQRCRTQEKELTELRRQLALLQASQLPGTQASPCSGADAPADAPYMPLAFPQQADKTVQSVPDLPSQPDAGNTPALSASPPEPTVPAPALISAPDPISVSVPPVADASRALKSESSWQDWFLGNIFNKIGALALIICAFLFVKLVTPNLGPWFKLGLGWAASVAVTVLGVCLRRRPHMSAYAEVLMGVGVAASFVITFWGAFASELLSLNTAFVIGSLQLLVVYALAGCMRSPWLLILTLAGGYGNLFCIDNSQQPHLILGYIFFLNVLAVSGASRCRLWLYTMCLNLALSLTLAGLEYGNKNLDVLLLFAGCIWLLYTVFDVLRSKRDPAEFARQSPYVYICFAALNLFCFTCFWEDFMTLGWITASVSLGYALFAGFARLTGLQAVFIRDYCNMCLVAALASVSMLCDDWLRVWLMAFLAALIMLLAVLTKYGPFRGWSFIFLNASAVCLPFCHFVPLKLIFSGHNTAETTLTHVEGCFSSLSFPGNSAGFMDSLEWCALGPVLMGLVIYAFLSKANGGASEGKGEDGSENVGKAADRSTWNVWPLVLVCSLAGVALVYEITARVGGGKLHSITCEVPLTLAVIMAYSRCAWQWASGHPDKFPGRLLLAASGVCLGFCSLFAWLIILIYNMAEDMERTPFVNYCALFCLLWAGSMAWLRSDRQAKGLEHSALGLAVWCWFISELYNLSLVLPGSFEGMLKEMGFLTGDCNLGIFLCSVGAMAWAWGSLGLHLRGCWQYGASWGAASLLFSLVFWWLMFSGSSLRGVTPVFNSCTFTALLAVAYALIWRHRLGKDNIKAWQERLSLVFLYLLGLFWCSTEARLMSVYSGWGTMLSLYWVLYATAVICLGLKYVGRLYTGLGILTVLLACSRIILVDISSLKLEAKLAVFFIMGVALLGLSYYYTKRKKTVTAPQDTEKGATAEIKE